MMIPVVLTDSPDAGTLQVVPLSEAIELADRRFGTGYGRSRAWQNGSRFKDRANCYDRFVSLMEVNESPYRIRCKCRITKTQFQRYRARYEQEKHPRRVQNGSGIISEGPYLDPPKTHCEILG